MAHMIKSANQTFPVQAGLFSIQYQNIIFVAGSMNFPQMPAHIVENYWGSLHYISSRRPFGNSTDHFPSPTPSIVTMTEHSTERDYTVNESHLAQSMAIACIFFAISVVCLNNSLPIPPYIYGHADSCRAWAQLSLPEQLNCYCVTT